MMVVSLVNNMQMLKTRKQKTDYYIDMAPYFGILHFWQSISQCSWFTINEGYSPPGYFGALESTVLNLRRGDSAKLQLLRGFTDQWINKTIRAIRSDWVSGGRERRWWSAYGAAGALKSTPWPVCELLETRASGGFRLYSIVLERRGTDPESPRACLLIDCWALLKAGPVYSPSCAPLALSLLPPPPPPTDPCVGWLWMCLSPNKPNGQPENAAVCTSVLMSFFRWRNGKTSEWFLGISPRLPQLVLRIL